ncbi:MAG: hypothetical protein RIC04_10065 [Parvibaculum sp.]|uniref:hypothetical protein n=1 Tax=Parvibaculum sp. TaxID=2024848 RepID=UPI0032EDDCDC
MSALAKVGPATAAVLLAGLMLAGCTAIPDSAKPEALYGGTPAPASPEAAFPDLRSVPAKAPQTTPPAEQQRIADGLADDRDQARYADQLLRSGTAAPASSRPAGPVPPPLQPLENIPPGIDEKRALYENAPIIPMPERGGHRDMTAVFTIETASRAPTDEEAATVTEDGAPAASGPDTGPEVTPAPTKRVTVKPVIGQP